MMQRCDEPNKMLATTGRPLQTESYHTGTQATVRSTDPYRRPDPVTVLMVVVCVRRADLHLVVPTQSPQPATLFWAARY